jgi:hypothetical protein
MRDGGGCEGAHFLHQGIDLAFASRPVMSTPGTNFPGRGLGRKSFEG